MLILGIETATVQAGCAIGGHEGVLGSVAVARGRRFASAMHKAHPVPEDWQDWLRPETVVCRCEETTVVDLCTARDQLGADDARTAKLVARPGMGWCQGRVCGFATASITFSASSSVSRTSMRWIASPGCLSWPLEFRRQ